MHIQIHAFIIILFIILLYINELHNLIIDTSYCIILLYIFTMKGNRPIPLYISIRLLLYYNVKETEVVYKPISDQCIVSMPIYVTCVLCTPCILMGM